MRGPSSSSSSLPSSEYHHHSDTLDRSRRAMGRRRRETRVSLSSLQSSFGRRSDFFFICSCPPRWFHASVLRLMMFTHKNTHTHTHAHAHTRKNSHIHTNRIIIIHYPSLLLSSASPFVRSFSSLLLSSANKTDGWMDG